MAGMDEGYEYDLVETTFKFGSIIFGTFIGLILSLIVYGGFSWIMG